MEKKYRPQKVEEKIYKFWEKNGFFKPNLKKNKKPWCCIMPPPNANAPLHVGHAVFVTIEDILTRFQRMKQRPTLWLPGFDHAGFETQYVYEKKKGGVFSKEKRKLYKDIFRYTQENRKVAREQIKILGASADWSREKFTLDPDIIKTVYNTFKKLYNDGLIYRGERIINWCLKDKTSLSDLEVNYQNQNTKLWYIKYPLKNQKTKSKNQIYITIATVRPETMFGDTAIAVNPKDKRYKKLIGKKAVLPLVNKEIPIIADKAVEMQFGTGAVKVTPAHDPLDFEIAERHNLEKINIISKSGTIYLPKKFPAETKRIFNNLKILEARERVLLELKKQKLIEKEEEYKNKISVCYKCKTPIEPLISKQWFIKIDPLAKKAIKLAKEGKIKFYPEYYKKIFLHWMKKIYDWNISRQIVWGIRIPIYYCKDKKTDKCKKQDGVIVSDIKPKKCPYCGSGNLVEETDVFDTWFSSGQWPFAALGYPNSKDYKNFYPTSVMETGWDILFFWVARMIMLGVYVTEKPPFYNVLLHGLVRDKDRQKMSKSKGNVIDPLAVVSEYGADALRMALVFGNTTGRDAIISEEKVKGQRNFTNKIWNASRFVLMQLGDNFDVKKIKPKYTKEDKWIVKELKKTQKKVTKAIESYKLHHAADEIYHFFWHKFCDKTIEDCKKRIVNEKNNKNDKDTARLILWKVLYESLKILHPFMPFVTEEIYQKLPKKEKNSALIIEKW